MALVKRVGDAYRALLDGKPYVQPVTSFALGFTAGRLLTGAEVTPANTGLAAMAGAAEPVGSIAVNTHLSMRNVPPDLRRSRPAIEIQQSVIFSSALASGAGVICGIASRGLDGTAPHALPAVGSVPMALVAAAVSVLYSRDARDGIARLRAGLTDVRPASKPAAITYDSQS